MANLNHYVNAAGTTYMFEDTEARNNISTHAAKIGTIKEVLSNLNTNDTNIASRAEGLTSTVRNLQYMAPSVSVSGTTLTISSVTTTPRITNGASGSLVTNLPTSSITRTDNATTIATL